MRRLDIEVAGEFLVMAATLAEMKVRSLIPRYAPADDEELPLEDEGSDPRLDLIRQLLRFRFFKERAGLIEKLMELRASRFPRPHIRRSHAQEAASSGLEEETWEIADASPFVLAVVTKRLREETARSARGPIYYDDIPIEDKIEEIIAVLASRGRVLFHELISDPANPVEVVTSFLAVLELVKQRLAAVRSIPEINAIVVMRPEDAPPAATDAQPPAPAFGSIEIVPKIPADPLLAELAHGLVAAHDALAKIKELKHSFLQDDAEPSAENAPGGESPSATAEPDASPLAPAADTSPDAPRPEDASPDAADTVT